MKRSLIVAVVATFAAGLGQAGAAVPVTAKVVDQFFVSGSYYQGGVQVSTTLVIESTKSVSASIDVSPTAGLVQEITIQGSFNFCDVVDWDPCGSWDIPRQDVDAAFGLLGNSLVASTEILATGYGSLPLVLNISRPNQSWYNMPNGRAPNAWTDGPAAHVDLTADGSSFARGGYTVSLSMDGYPLSNGFTFYSLTHSALASADI